MPSPTVNARTRKEWRELGFFQDRDDATRRWLLVGSRSGLARFCELLRAYVADPRNAQVSEHEHYGPYGSLEVMTWTEPRLDGHAISGRLEDLAALATLVQERVAASLPGQSFSVGREYAPTSDFDLVLEVAPDGFDPAAADPDCADTPAP